MTTLHFAVGLERSLMRYITSRIQQQWPVSVANILVDITVNDDASSKQPRMTISKSSVEHIVKTHSLGWRRTAHTSRQYKAEHNSHIILRCSNPPYHAQKIHKQEQKHTREKKNQVRLGTVADHNIPTK